MQSQLIAFPDGVPSPILHQWQLFNLEKIGGQGENLNHNLVLLGILDTPDHTAICVSLPLDTRRPALIGGLIGENTCTSSTVILT